MEYASKILSQVVAAFSQLPGIGEKSAQRIALYLLQDDHGDGDRLARALDNLKNVGFCSVCYNLTEEDPCALCTDLKRDRSLICVVEEAKDLMVIEKTGGFKGLYHVLGGILSPLEGVGETDLKIKELLSRVDDSVREVIIATNPTMEGEMTAAHLIKLLKAKSVKVSRIARGIPFGGALEFNDSVTVSKSLEGRTEV